MWYILFLLNCIFKFNFLKKIKIRTKKSFYIFDLLFLMKNHRFVKFDFQIFDNFVDEIYIFFIIRYTDI